MADQGAAPPERLARGHRGTSRPAPGETPEAVRKAVLAFQAGDRTEASFRVLFETYRPAVHAYFTRRLGSPDLGFELTQETFLRVFKGLRGFRSDGPFGAWLFRIAGNVLRRHYASAAGRSAARQVAIEDSEAGAAAQLAADAPAGDEDRPLAAAIHSERQRLLRRAVLQLPPQRRRCVVLWAYHELSYEQIATVLRLSLGTVKAHLAQARKQLAGLVVEAAGEHPEAAQREEETTP